MVSNEEKFERENTARSLRWERFDAEFNGISSDNICTRSVKFVIRLWKNWTDRASRCPQCIVLYFLILMLAGTGGAIFCLIEYDEEQRKIDKYHEIHNELIKTFNKTNLALIYSYDKFDPIVKEFANLGKNRWEFHYSAFFAATTFTTNGFGIQYPATTYGKLFCFLYGFPAIVGYFGIARQIGLLAIIGIEAAWCRIISREKYLRCRGRLLALTLGVVYFILAILLKAQATDVGFGQGMYTLADAIYFLFTTTFTIGFGDVMMSGNSGFGLVLTGLLALWLATTSGIMLCFLTKMNKQEEETKTLTTCEESKVVSNE